MKGRLRTICALAFAACLFSRPGAAQVLLKLQAEHTQLVRYEAANVFVSILNESPFALMFGGENGAELRFFVELGRDTVAERYNEGPLAGNLAIDAGLGRDVLCDISRWYDLGPVGNYSVRAVVEWRGKTYQSNPVRFDIVNGLPISKETRTIWADREFVREFTLCYLAREGAEHIFLSVDDKRAGINYGVFDLGAIIRLHEPILQVGRDGSVKVLHQSGFGRFTLNKLAVSSDKVRFVDQSYLGEDGKPFDRKNVTKNAAEAESEVEPPPEPISKRRSLFRLRRD